MKRLYNEYLKLKNAYDKLDEMVAEGAYELEAEWDKAYDDMWAVQAALVSEVVNMIGCTAKIARDMIDTDKFADIMNRWEEN